MPANGTPRPLAATTASVTNSIAPHSGMPSSRARCVVMPWTSVAPAGISRPGSMRPDQLVTTTPSTTRTRA